MCFSFSKMVKCILCLKASLEVDYVDIRDNFIATVSIADTIAQHFPFINLDLKRDEHEDIGDRQSCCKQCVNDLGTIQSFFEKIKLKHFSQFNDPVDGTKKFSVKVEFVKPEIDAKNDVSKRLSRRARGRPKNLEKESEKIKKRERPNENAESDLVTQMILGENIEENRSFMPAKAYRRRTSADERRISETVDMKCDLCTTEFESFSHALMHYKEIHNQTGYLMCCSKKFRQKTTLVDHLDFHDNPDVFKCKICLKCFPGLTNLKWHLQFIHFSPAYQCDICGKFRKTKRSINSHVESHMANLSKQSLNPCQSCNKICSSTLSLKLHVSNCHNPNRETFCCEICGKKLMSKLSLKEHITNIHSTTNTKTQCSICGHFIKNASSMKKHLSRHKYDTNIICKECGKVCTTRAALSSHMRIKHLLQRILPCRFCDKRFKQKISLIEHEATHTGIDLYTCLWCPATFKFGANFRAHRKSAHPEEYEKVKPSWLRPT